MKKVALVTGSSSGIGYETSLALAKEGFTTFATMRNVEDGKKILEIGKKEGYDIKILQLDVNSDESVKRAVEEIISSEGKIDVLINNAGYGLFGCVEDVSLEKFKEQFDTNFFGVIRMIQEIAPKMREQNSGTIINISSIAGRIGFPTSPAYVSSKFALEGLSECMRYEMSPFGIRTVLIEPGVIKTKFMESIKVEEKIPESPYKEITNKVISGIRIMSGFGTPAEEVAKTIILAIKSDEPLPRYLVGNDASMFIEAKKMKTDIEFEKYIKKELYGE